ncbi:unknown [Crocosphaera subtropica ATCC 51142]|uniref:Uncharacterized protein n=1 Tax=Crocosphaera subtropica (strain ATCC 51142 / BH68) TaxID=43989 RepID=B1WX55_CROS5|nr:hypothetical protein [Crocosphaera subtropica]ACB50799.1 unknown [Crocosphaera subtropica ATCC 51142]
MINLNYLPSINIILVPCLAMLPNVVKAEQILLLNLQYKSDATITREIQFYGNDIDPNSTSIDDNFSLKIDGKLIEAPDELYRRLDRLRRSFSYDSLSGGIQDPSQSIVSCNLGGPAEGMILSVRYLTYQDFKIVDHEMRPVFGLAENCLFKELYQPVNSNAKEDARGVIEILNTLNLLGY